MTELQIDGLWYWLKCVGCLLAFAAFLGGLLWWLARQEYKEES